MFQFFQREMVDVPLTLDALVRKIILCKKMFGFLNQWPQIIRNWFYIKSLPAWLFFQLHNLFCFLCLFVWRLLVCLTWASSGPKFYSTLGVYFTDLILVVVLVEILMNKQWILVLIHANVPTLYLKFARKFELWMSTWPKICSLWYFSYISDQQ